MVTVYLKWLDDTHRPHDAGDDEGRGSKQFPDGETSGVGSHCRKRGEDIRTAIPKCQKRHAGDVLIKSQQLRDGSKIWREEIRGTNAESREEKDKPDNEAYESE